MTTNSDIAVRVGDPERARTASILGRGLTQGYLSMAEYETRLGRAFEAATVDVLSDLTVDLPVRRIVRHDPRRRAARRAAARRGALIHLGVYLAVSLLMIVAWLATAVAAGQWYFWPVWPILGWGIGIAAHYSSVSIRPASIAVHSGR